VLFLFVIWLLNLQAELRSAPGYLALKAIAGLLSAALVVFIYWLAALARGARAYARAQELLGSDMARVVYVAIIAAFAYHLVAGIRHLVWDTGRGLEKTQSERSAWMVIAGALVLTVVCAWWAFRAREGGV